MPEETINDQQHQDETSEQKYARLYTQQAQNTQETADELKAAIGQLQQEIATLRSKPTAAQRETVEENLSVEGSALWVDKIRQGDFVGAQRVIAEEVQRSLKPEFEKVRQEAYQQALTASQVNIEMDKYLNRVRADNPDIIQFERYLQAPVNQRIETARSAGKIKSGDDLVREYKAAVDAEVTELRNLGLQFRAAGKDEALTRKREVLSSTTLEPQQVKVGQTPNVASETASETTDDYFARRRADESRRRGLPI